MANLQAVLSSTSVLVTYGKKKKKERKRAYHAFTLQILWRVWTALDAQLPIK